MVTDKDYFRITNCTSIGGFSLPSFTIEEVQLFLKSLGYEIVVHKTLAKVELVTMGFNEVERSGKYEDMEREAILAVKPGQALPERIDSKEASEMNFLRVFAIEMKKKLLL